MESIFSVYLENTGPLQCRFCPEVEKLFITNGYVSGLRKDLNGVLLLDSILQPPLKGPCLDPVVLELTLSDVSVKLYNNHKVLFSSWGIRNADNNDSDVADDCIGSSSGAGGDNEDNNDTSIISFDYSSQQSLEQKKASEKFSY